MDMKDAFLRIAKAERNITLVLNALENAGCSATPLSEAHGFLTDAVYVLVGEKMEMAHEFGDTVAYKVMNSTDFSDDEKAEMLMKAYEMNHPTPPKPVVYEPSDMKESVRKNGGYIYEMPEGDWN